MSISHSPLIATVLADDTACPPDPGSTFVGRVYGFTYDRATGMPKVMILRTDDGEEVCVRMRPSELQEVMDDFALMEGDRVGLKYLGQNPDTLNYVVRVIVDEELDGEDGCN